MALVSAHRARKKFEAAYRELERKTELNQATTSQQPYISLYTSTLASASQNIMLLLKEQQQTMESLLARVARAERRDAEAIDRAAIATTSNAAIAPPTIATKRTKC